MAVFHVLERVKGLTVELRVESFVFRRLEMFQGNTRDFAVSCTVGGRTATKCCWLTLCVCVCVCVCVVCVCVCGVWYVCVCVCVPFGNMNVSSACTTSTLEVD